MKKVSRRSITSEYLFEADDGKTFPYEGQAIEHDIKLVEDGLGKLKLSDISIRELNLIGSIYEIETKKDLSLMEKYAELKDFSLKSIDIPTKIIVTDNFVLSIEELKKVINEIDNM